MTYSLETGSETYHGGDWCLESCVGNEVEPQVGTDLSRYGISATASFGLMAAQAGQTVYGLDESGNDIDVSVFYASSRDSITNPTYSYTNGTETDTTTGGKTLVTTNTTTASFSVRQITTNAPASILASLGGGVFEYGNSRYCNIQNTVEKIAITTDFNFTTTTIESNTTITGLPTTVTGYHFGLLVRSAQALWNLDPLFGGGRLSPAFSASCAWPGATPLFATDLSGTHAFLTISTVAITDSSEDQEIFEYNCPYDEIYCSSPPKAGAGQSGWTSSNALFGVTSYDISSPGVGPVSIYRPHVSGYVAQMPALNSPVSAQSILQSFSADPTYFIAGKTVGISQAVQCTVSRLGGGLVSPFYFTGKSTGEVGVGMSQAPATLSWDNSDLLYTLTYTSETQITAPLDVAPFTTIILTTTAISVEDSISFLTTSTQASQLGSQLYFADTNFHRPPLQKSNDPNFNPLESYGASSDSYVVVVTDSSGSTSSIFTMGTASRTIGTNDYARPIRKGISNRAYTTSSYVTEINFVPTVNLPLTSGFYGQFYAGGMSQMAAEESVEFRSDRTVILPP